jgi:hypothetical protein
MKTSVLAFLLLIGLPALADTPTAPCPPAEEPKECEFDSECADSSLRCATRVDGKKVCLGKGGQNDYCVYSTDCGPGLMCQGRIKDGMRICMGQGQLDDCCRMALDCLGNLMCRNRGDGFLVCRP